MNAARTRKGEHREPRSDEELAAYYMAFAWHCGARSIAPDDGDVGNAWELAARDWPAFIHDGADCAAALRRKYDRDRSEREQKWGVMCSPSRLKQ